MTLAGVQSHSWFSALKTNSRNCEYIYIAMPNCLGSEYFQVKTAPVHAVHRGRGRSMAQSAMAHECEWFINWFSWFSQESVGFFMKFVVQLSPLAPSSEIKQTCFDCRCDKCWFGCKKGLFTDGHFWQIHWGCPWERGKNLLLAVNSKRFLHTAIGAFWVRDGAVKSTETRQGWETQEHHPTTEQCQPPLWPPTQCTCIPGLLCYLHNKAN